MESAEISSSAALTSCMVRPDMPKASPCTDESRRAERDTSVAPIFQAFSFFVLALDTMRAANTISRSNNEKSAKSGTDLTKPRSVAPRTES